MYEKKELSDSKKEEVKEAQVEIHKVKTKQCHGPKVTGGTTSLCTNRAVPMDAITTGVIAQIPVVLAKLVVQINMNALIELPELAYEIKEIKNKIKVTQSLLMQDTNMLFIKGVIQKHINYALSNDCRGGCIYGELKQCTVDIPFNCTTNVLFNGNSPLQVENNKRDEFAFSRRSEMNRKDFSQKDQLLSNDSSEHNQVDVEFYNELPYCRLVNSKIIENDKIIKDKILEGSEDSCEGKVFNKIEENMVVFLTLKILQNQQVKIPGPSMINLGLGIDLGGCI
ncbi:MAG: hypothetical protein N4A64_05215 [Marinisporobacter sp.]|nr:hypothetical protein [Marinisporobacter sp.]